MPAELPGFYWDEARNRYFPLSSRPKPPQPPADTISSNHRKTIALRSSENDLNTISRKRKRSYVPWHTNEMRRSVPCYAQGLSCSHEILCSHYASTSRLTRARMPTFGAIRAFCATKVAGQTWRFVGDNQGWLYSDKASQPVERHGIHHWSADMNLQPSSPISSISVSGSRCVSTCLGPGKISVQDLASPERTYLVNLNGVSDIRASHLQRQELVLGASKKAVYISDIDVTTSPQYLRTNSDVFSVIQRDYLVYAGTRNGSIERFDIRMAKHRSERLFDLRFGRSQRSSVLYLNIIRDHELLLSHLNGDLVTFDLRFSPTTSEASPIRIFEGHVNTYTHNLGIAIDTEQDFLFAAGQDCLIRGWSLRTALPLLPPISSSPFQAHRNPFSTIFPHPICALQVTEETGEDGTSLWAAGDQDLYQFHLGQRSTVMT